MATGESCRRWVGRGAGLLGMALVLGSVGGCGRDGLDLRDFLDHAAQANTGAGGADAGSAGAEPTSTVGDRRVPFAPHNDVAFIDFFVPHHQNAIRMAEAEIARGTRAEVKQLAEQMKTDQAGEIDVMRAARTALTGQADSPPPPRDPHMEADLADMNQATGDLVDQLFLEGMIPHHAAGLPVAHRADINLSREDMHFFSQHFFDEQANEIGTMKRLLGDPTACPAGGGVLGCPTAADLAVAGDRRIPFTPADDVAFIDFFVQHHQMAIDMANREVAAGDRTDVKALARQIVDEQTAEIQQMKKIRQALTGTDQPAQQPQDPHATADMALMQRLTAGALDDRFLHDMTQHHAAGLAPAHRAQPLLKSDELREMARNIFSSQSQQIGTMQMLRFQQ